MFRVSARFRLVLVVGLLAATVGAFVYYFAGHPEIRTQLAHTSRPLLALLLLLYLLFTVSIGFILMASVWLCRATIGVRESLLLTMYSAIINFFGPLQSGPAFRAIYLKNKHGVKLRDYTLASLVYYAFYGLFNVALLFSSVIGWWLLVVIAAIGAAFVWLPHSGLSAAQRFRGLRTRGVVYSALATLLQVAIMVLIYFVELRAVAHGVQFSQVLTYTGAANLALFVSITPGAIGFRESFLLLSQQLHHIDSSTVLAASVIDRAAYIVLLLLLLVVILATHTQKRLRAVTKDPASN